MAGKFEISLSTLFLDNACETAEEMLDEKTLSQIAGHGFSNIELVFVGVSLPWRDRSFIENLKQQMEKHNLKVHSVHAPVERPPSMNCVDPSIRRGIVGNIKEYIHALAPLGPDFIIVHPGPLAGYRDTIEQLRAALHESLISIVEAASEYDMRIHIETLPYPDHPQFLADVIQTLPRDRFGVCIDTGHVNMLLQKSKNLGLPSYSFSEVIELFGERLLSIHANDNIAADLKDAHLLPGDGDVPWSEILSALEKIDFKGCFTFENKCFGSPEAILAGCRKWRDRYLLFSSAKQDNK